MARKHIFIGCGGVAPPSLHYYYTTATTEVKHFFKKYLYKFRDKYSSNFFDQKA